MALETLAGIKTIDGFGVVEIDVGGGQGISSQDYIVVDHNDNTIRFKIQNGPIGETGINGCQVDTMVEASLLIIRGLNQKFPCRENSITITKLEEALHWLRNRKSDREKRKVEGTNKP